MKYCESTFEEYVRSVQQTNYHPELKSIPCHSISQFPHTIYYGPRGVGKYSQMLARLAPLSPTSFKYQKKMTVTTEKGDYSFLFSDIHYEIDMGLLGCNAKIIWDAFFQQIVDMVSIKPDKAGIIVCKNFHQIHAELLDIFFLYFKQFQQKHNVLFNKNNIVIKYVLLTEHLSFLPSSLIHSCTVISVARPSKQVLLMGKSSKIREKANTFALETLGNLKEIHCLGTMPVSESVDLFEKVCHPLLSILFQDDDAVAAMDLLKVREYLYNISIYQIDFVECLWYFLWKLSQYRPNISSWKKLLQETAVFLKYYNNNYRTIYHFESIFYSLYLFYRETETTL